MAYIPASNSVVGFQSQPSSLLVGASVIGLTPVNVVNMPSSSVISYQAAGSVMAVSGTFTANPQSSIIATQIAGSILAVNMPSPSIVATQIAGSVMNVQISGSIASANFGTQLTSVMNTVPSSMLVGASVMGTVPVTQVTSPWIINTPTPSYIAIQSAGSILAAAVTQTTSPWLVNVPTPSYISYQAAGSILAVSGTFSSTPQGSITALQLAGSIMAVNATQGTSPWIINMPSPSVVATQIANSVMGVRTDNASVVAVLSNSSVTALQGTNPWIIGNSSVTVMGTYLEKNAVTASAVGIPVLFKIDETNSVLSAVSPQSPLPIKGSVTTLQGTNPWMVNVPTPSYISYQAAGSIMQVSNSSVVVNNIVTGQSSVYLIPGVGVLGSVAVLQGTNPWLVGNSSVVVNNIVTGQSSVYLIPGVGVLGSVATLQGTNPWLTQIIGGSVLGTYTENSITTASVIGHAILYKKDETNSVLSAVSPQHPLPIQGSVAVLQGTNPWIVNVPTPSYLSIQPGGSVMNVNVSGSVAVGLATGVSSVMLFGSTNTSITTLVSNQLMGVSSVMLFGSTNASVAVLASQNTNPWIVGSIVGTYAENSAATAGGVDKGLFTLGVRNDTLSSVTGADKDYTQFTVGPTGETITANAPITKWTSGLTSVMSGTSVQVLAAPGTSIFTYITGIYVTNEASVASRVTITQGLGRVASSFLTVLIAPAGGGSNNMYINPLRVLDNNGVSASISAVASIYVTITGFTAKT